MPQRDEYLEEMGLAAFNLPIAERAIATPGAQSLALASFVQLFCQRLHIAMVTLPCADKFAFAAVSISRLHQRFGCLSRCRVKVILLRFAGCKKFG